MEAYAKRILEIDREELAISYPYLTVAIYSLTPKILLGSGLGPGVDGSGELYFFDPEELIGEFISGKDTALSYLHSVLHCLFLHPFLMTSDGDREEFDLACDICIKDVTDSLCKSKALGEDELKRASLVNDLKKELPVLTPGGVQRVLKGKDADHMLFKVDCHSFWQDRKGIRRDYWHGDRGETHISDGVNKADHNEISSEADNKPAFNENLKGRGLAKWKRIGLETELFLIRSGRTGEIRGEAPGDLLERLRDIERKQLNYEDFLKRFAVPEEIMKADPDSFDYPLYSYGFELYGDMPIIEPNEYSEKNRVREFAIAIDTSLSCETELVRSFLEKTYDILYSSMSPGERRKTLLIQCDSGVQQEDVIFDREGLKKYMKRVSIHGRGGTDFRPVFKRLDELKEKGEFPSLKGLIYFTDGEGVYPENPPKYKIAFILPYGGAFRKVPDWAEKAGFKP